ncbi:MAG: D-alanyl-D-alanine carboxypeptidase [Clostridia bacterium]|nr:D-alanyl-D-alanine carboxypeptidase [Clostridia bacterium]
MYIKRRLKHAFTILLSILILLSMLPQRTKAEALPYPDAASFLLMEKEDRKILAKSNERASLPIASTTKILTCLVVLERCETDDIVVVDPQAVGIEGSSAYLRAGERLTVKELLYCLMLRSANDAAVALALHLSGSIEEFAYLMNEKAKSLGMEGSHFQNPHGLHEENHYSTAYDLAILFADALESPQFCGIVSTKSIVIGKNENARTLTNHNKLLFSLEGCIGGKTGYTIYSGRCLVSACKREDTTLICVTLGCRQDWQAHNDLYDYGFSTVKRFSYRGFCEDLPLAGLDGRVFVSSDSYSLLATPGATVEFFPLCPRFLFAPVDAGKEVGYVLVMLNGNAVDVLPILTREDAACPPPPSIIARILSKILALFE